MKFRDLSSRKRKFILVIFLEEEFPTLKKKSQNLVTRVTRYVLLVIVTSIFGTSFPIKMESSVRPN